MTRRVNAVDRLVTALVGLVLLAGGLLALDWYAGLVLDLPDRLDAAAVADTLQSGWWPWVSALVGVLLGLVGLRWLAAHVPGRGPGAARLASSDQTGTLSVDLRSVAGSIADRLEELGPVTSTSGTTDRIDGQKVLVVTGRVEDDADPAALNSAVQRCTAEAEQALEGQVPLRILLDAPRRVRRSQDRVHLQ